MARRRDAGSRPRRGPTQLLRNRARNRWIRLAALVDKAVIRRPHYVHEQELTEAQRADLAAVLEEWLRHPMSWSLEPDPGFAVSVAYHAGFLLAASWLLFSGTEAPELGAVFEKHRIDLHPDWWLSDGWGDYHDQYGVTCAGPAGCGGYTYALPSGMWLDPQDHMHWPQRCAGCHAPLPVQHRPRVYPAANGAFWADCSCGDWETERPMGERYARGAATRHVNTATRAAQLVDAQPLQGFAGDHWT